jgi:hypothetical protein
MRSTEEFKPGVYRHYKGEYYVALCLARHHDTGEPLVVYVCCTRATTNVREWDSISKDSWSDHVDPDTGRACVPSPRSKPRFEYTGPSVKAPP